MKLKPILLSIFLCIPVVFEGSIKADETQITNEYSYTHSEKLFYKKIKKLHKKAFKEEEAGRYKKSLSIHLNILKMI